MEIEFFVPPTEAEEWYTRWLEHRMGWYKNLGIRPDHLRLREHGPTSSPTTPARTADIEYMFPMGWSELEGIANRSDFDLTPARGVLGRGARRTSTRRRRALRPVRDRAVGGRRPRTLAFMVDAYDEEEVRAASAGAAASPAARSGQGGRAAAGGKTAMPEQARYIYEELRELMPAEFDRAARSASATGARTRSARPGA